MNKTAIEEFAAKLLAALNEYKKDMGLTYFDSFRVITEIGQKYIRYYSVEVQHDGGLLNKSIIAFVDIFNGEIMKPATYKSPAKTKGRRGNILADDGGASAITRQGRITYLKGGNY